MNKKLPPYGKVILQALAARETPYHAVIIFAGRNAWQRAKDFQRPEHTLVLPDYSHHADFTWPVKDCHVTILDKTFYQSDCDGLEAFATSFAISLYQQHALSVSYHFTDKNYFYQREKE